MVDTHFSRDKEQIVVAGSAISIAYALWHSDRPINTLGKERLRAHASSAQIAGLSLMGIGVNAVTCTKSVFVLQSGPS